MLAFDFPTINEAYRGKEVIEAASSKPLLKSIGAFTSKMLKKFVPLKVVHN